MVQKRLTKLWSNQINTCYFCGEDLVTPMEVYSGFCEKCIKKQKMPYLNWDPKKFFQ